MMSGNEESLNVFYTNSKKLSHSLFSPQQRTMTKPQRWHSMIGQSEIDGRIGERDTRRHLKRTPTDVGSNPGKDIFVFLLRLNRFSNIFNKDDHLTNL